MSATRGDHATPQANLEVVVQNVRVAGEDAASHVPERVQDLVHDARVQMHGPDTRLEGRVDVLADGLRKEHALARRQMVEDLRQGLQRDGVPVQKQRLGVPWARGRLSAWQPTGQTSPSLPWRSAHINAKSLKNVER